MYRRPFHEEPEAIAFAEAFQVNKKLEEVSFIVSTYDKSGGERTYLHGRVAEDVASRTYSVLVHIRTDIAFDATTRIVYVDVLSMQLLGSVAEEKRQASWPHDAPQHSRRFYRVMPARYEVHFKLKPQLPSFLNTAAVAAGQIGRGCKL